MTGDAYSLGYVSVGRILKVGIEYSLEDPQGGIHFVVPEGTRCRHYKVHQYFHYTAKKVTKYWDSLAQNA